MKIWALKTDWVIESGEHSSDITLFASYPLAKKAFDTAVKDEVVNYFSDVFNTDNLNEDSYDVELAPNYWCIWESGAYLLNHSELSLVELEVQEEEK